MKKLKAIYIFSAFWVATFGIILTIDVTHPGLSTTPELIKSTLSGSIFLAEATAILLTTAVVCMWPQVTGRVRVWVAMSGMTLILIAAGYLLYFQTPKSLSNSGHSTIVYNCIFGELYNSAVNNSSLCILKNIPLAASSPVSAIYESTFSSSTYGPQIITLGFSQLLIGGAAYLNYQKTSNTKLKRKSPRTSRTAKTRVV